MHQKLAKKNGEQWERYYPVPADLFKAKDDDTYYRLTCADQPARGNWPADNLRPLHLPPDVEAKPVAGWISHTALAAYLADGNLPSKIEECILKPENVYQTESRFNHKLERDPYRPAPQFLTETGYLRLCPNIGLDVDVAGVDPWSPPVGYLGIGGEAGTGYYRWPSPASLPKPGCDTLPEQFLIYFATPTWFERGWQPADWGKWFAGSPLSLVAAAVSRPQRIGGWNLTKNKKGVARVMKGYVPAGSVYYFKHDGSVVYNDSPVTDDPDEGKIGFGQILIGRWPAKNN